MPPAAEHRGFMGYRSSRAVTPGDGDGGMQRTLIGNTCRRVRRPPSAERGGYWVGWGGVCVGGGGSKHSDRARTRMHTHTHKGLCENKAQEKREM